ncbi:DUF2892 domain-containing protein [Mesobacillus foraminis]|uniref:YgaP family membrane protein n=1 Tax=Mesobacillus foraminis TaxID=279826 RepID=UPI0039A398C8
MFKVKVTQNIGMVNSLVRITCGLTMLSWATAKMVKKPNSNSYMIMAILAAMKVGEGIVRYCPVTALYQDYQDGQESLNHSHGYGGGDADSQPDVINPT